MQVFVALGLFCLTLLAQGSAVKGAHCLGLSKTKCSRENLCHYQYMCLPISSWSEKVSLDCRKNWRNTNQCVPEQFCTIKVVDGKENCELQKNISVDEFCSSRSKKQDCTSWLECEWSGNNVKEKEEEGEGKENDGICSVKEEYRTELTILERFFNLISF